MAVTNVWLVPVTISIAVVALMHSGELTDPPEIMGQMIVILGRTHWTTLTIFFRVTMTKSPCRFSRPH